MKRKCSLKSLMIAIFLLCAVICAVGVIKMDTFPNQRIPLMTKPAFEKGWTYQAGGRQGTVDSFPFHRKDKTDTLI